MRIDPRTLASPRIACALALAFAARTAAAQGAAATSPPAKPLRLDRWTWGMEADQAVPVRRVEVRNDFGDIRARFAGDRRIEASGVIQRLGAEEVGVTVERRGGAVVLTVTRPSGSIHDTDPNPSKTSMDRLDLTLYLPEGVALDARTTRGMVEARAVRSDVAAETLDGDITVITRRSAWARTAGGGVRVTLDSDVDGEPTVLVSDSGEIVLTLSSGVGVDVRAETGGDLRAGLPMVVRRENGRSRAAGVVGTPRRNVEIFSRSGPIRIERPIP